jgi:hypothetical protein
MGDDSRVDRARSRPSCRPMTASLNTDATSAPYRGSTSGAPVGTWFASAHVVHCRGSMIVLISVAGIIGTMACRSPGREADALRPSSGERRHTVPVLNA